MGIGPNLAYNVGMEYRINLTNATLPDLYAEHARIFALRDPDEAEHSQHVRLWHTLCAGIEDAIAGRGPLDDARMIESLYL